RRSGCGPLASLVGRSRTVATRRTWRIRAISPARSLITFVPEAGTRSPPYRRSAHRVRTEPGARGGNSTPVSFLRRRVGPSEGDSRRRHGEPHGRQHRPHSDGSTAG